jgi:lysozyme
MTAREHLENQLRRHEGFRSKPYQDTVGVWTVGWGHNLTAGGLSRAACTVIFYEDLEVAKKAASGLTGWGGCNAARQNVLVNMAFNLGGSRLARFKNMLAAIERKDFETAAREMLQSKWAEQVGSRAKELAEQMKTGVLGE